MSAAIVLLVAQPALADWIQQAAPLPSGSFGGSLTGASCPSSSTCFAVGSYTDSGSVTRPLAEKSTNGSNWAVQGVGEPTGATSAQFSSISCVASTACWAVGSYDTSAGQFPFASFWDGQLWGLFPEPLVPPGGTNITLSSVTCTTSSDCTAVGSYTNGASTAPLIEARSNGSWTIQSPAIPAGATGASLSGVSCPVATNCMAVGSYTDSGGSHSLAETYNGTSWTVQSGLPAGTELNGVSCPAASECTVAGLFQADSWNGSAWTAEKVPTPSPNSGKTDFAGVSCLSAVSCYGVGSYFVDGVEQQVGEYWNGTRWVIQNLPIESSFDSAFMSGVGCFSAAICTAVGSYHDPTSGEQPLIENFQLRWQQQTASSASGSIASGATDVSCTTAVFCMAVDSFENSGGTFGTSALKWNGGSWQDIATPNSANSLLSGVSCTSSTACTAVGDVLGGSGSLVPLAERWDGSTWTVESMPAPAGAASSFLLSASCTSVKFCMAVGLWRDSSGNQFTLAESWNGTTWKLLSTVDPAGTTDNTLNHVACPNSTTCYAVGSDLPGTADSALIESWNGTAWSAQAAPLPSGGSRGTLEGIDCFSTAVCLAVGGYFNGTNDIALADGWNGTSWAAQSVPVPAGTSQSGLAGVSCSGPVTCIAVGSGLHPTTGTTATSERWNGSSWLVRPAGIPSSDSPSALEGVSCPSQLLCEAVGFYSPRGVGLVGNEIDLAEQWS